MPCADTSTYWNLELIRRYDLAGPRYTSYPTAPQFSDDFGRHQLLAAIEHSNRAARPLSLYVHIPFCDTVCYYCGCNKIVTANKSRAQPYLDRLHREIKTRAAQIDSARPVKQLHLGGGTPTYISDAQMAELIALMRKNFQFLPDDQGEYSIEIHPGGMKPERIAALRRMGFNRLSMGIQDFDETVQKAVNRFNTVAEVRELVSEAREQGFKSISMDLIYGLPHQTLQTMAATLERVIGLAPDRLSVFNYAHMPHLFKVQKQIDARALPEPQEKLTMLHYAIERLTEAGYVHIGMDHFAKPDDELAIAQREGKMQRNFQGYATCGDCDLFAFGVSSISAIDNIFVQNHKNIEDYQGAIDAGLEPIARGFVRSRDDEIRKKVIDELICHYRLDFAQIERRFNIAFGDYFAAELAQLQPMAADGLLAVDNAGIEVRNQGRLLVRCICMVFDAYLQQKSADTGPKYSRII